MKLTGRLFTALFLLTASACTHSRGAVINESPVRQLFVLAGQSNMAGRGIVEAEDKVPNPRIVMFDRAMNWVPAIDPVHFDKSVAGVGPGRGFALSLAERDPGMTIGLIPTAVGGSPISAWFPGGYDAATKTHPYDEALVRIRAAMRDGRVRAVLWHQGESDSSPEASVVYADKLRAVIAQFRTDIGDSSLPFLIGELGRFASKPWTAGRERVDSAQRAIAAAVPGVAFVSSKGLRDRGDTLHFDAASQREFGRRYAEAYRRLTGAR